MKKSENVNLSYLKDFIKDGFLIPKKFVYFVQKLKK